MQFTYSVNSVLVDFTGATIHIDFRPLGNVTGAVVQHLEITKGITVIGLGVFQIDPQIFKNFQPGTNLGYDIMITLASGQVRNDIRGTVTVDGAYTDA